MKLSIVLVSATLAAATLLTASLLIVAAARGAERVPAAQRPVAAADLASQTGMLSFACHYDVTNSAYASACAGLPRPEGAPQSGPRQSPRLTGAASF